MPRVALPDYPCPACLDREALNLLGLPIFDPKRGRLSANCEVCDNRGRVDEYGQSLKARRYHQAKFEIEQLAEDQGDGG